MNLQISAALVVGLVCCGVGVAGEHTAKQQTLPVALDVNRPALKMKSAPNYLLVEVWDDSYSLGYFVADFFCNKKYLHCKEHWD